MKYGWIAKKLGLTYKQVRRLVDILVDEGTFIKYQKYQKKSSYSLFLSGLFQNWNNTAMHLNSPYIHYTLVINIDVKRRVTLAIFIPFLQ